MEFDATFYVMATLAVIFAGISKGGFGSGAAFAAAPFLALVMDPATAVAFMLPLLMIMDITNLGPYWRKWDWKNAKAMMVGGVPGVVVGVAVFGYADADTIRILIGLIALGFVAFQLMKGAGWFSIPERPFSNARAGFWGGVAGFTSFVSHAGGPPAAVHLLGQRLDKQTYQATTVILFWWINVVKFVPYAALGLFTQQTLIANAIFVPVAVAGALLGVAAHRVISEKWYFRLTYIFLTITGSKLIFDGVT
ncbi:MAG: sulfite exporter TauE/SafE family protein [Pseudomonadota bacterium]